LTITKLFAIIKDGKWHTITDLSGQIKAQTDKLTEFSQFLCTQGIVTYEEKTARIKVEPEWQNLLPTETEPTLDKTKKLSKENPNA
jgi:hypothetical protein